MKRIIKIIALIIGLGSIQGVQAQTAITNKVTIDWDAVTQYVNGTTISDPVKYNVWRASSSDLSDLTKLNSAELTVLTYADDTLISNREYFYVVEAYVLNGLSSKSAAAGVQTFLPQPAVIRVRIE